MTLAPVLLNSIVESVKNALQEDVGSGDLTAQLIGETTTANATIISRESAVFCGQPWASQVFSQLSTAIKQTWNVQDGDQIQKGQIICQLSGPSRPLLTGERTALNFLQTLSGTATRTRQYVDAIKGTQAKILDTRKTVPGLRLAQKYAVQCGGGQNHRIGLYDGILIKENHIEACGSLQQAIDEALSVKQDILVEMEVESLEQLRNAIKAGVKRILLDNMNLEELRQAVRIADKKLLLEASGGITLENVRLIAETGVDYISIGDITKNIDAIDLSMRFDH
jgi:nicotinate-nucleotide pyrophosphorylase (carboxylating)